jgi:Ca-activated chloride channel homolog
MTLRTRISISLLVILCCSAGAQTAEDFFHSGAQSYLTNNVQLALQRVDEGLKRFPDDMKLKKLEELLKKQQQQQQQNQQDQKDQQQSKSDQNKDQKDQKDQKQDQKQNSDQQKKQNDQKQDQQSKQDQAKKDQKKDQQKPDQQKSTDQKKDQKPEDQSQQQAQYVPGQMTPQQAKQLLDAQKGEEMMMPVKVEEKPRQRSGPLKDW